MSNDTTPVMTVIVSNGRVVTDRERFVASVADDYPDVSIDTIRSVIDLPDGLTLIGLTNTAVLDAVDALNAVREAYAQHKAKTDALKADRQELITAMIVGGVDADTILNYSELPASTIIDWFYEVEKDAEGNTIKEERSVKVGNTVKRKMLPKKNKVDDRLTGAFEKELRDAHEHNAEHKKQVARLRKKGLIA